MPTRAMGGAAWAGIFTGGVGEAGAGFAGVEGGLETATSDLGRPSCSWRAIASVRPDEPPPAPQLYKWGLPRRGCESVC